MKVIAPGKVLLFGAYSVLEGTMALVVAVDRYAVADSERLAPSSSREVRAAIGDELAPELDLSSLHQDGEKLGLGSSAAALVATLGARAAMRGEDLAADAVRRGIFLDAKRAHAQAQGGGSGVDIAASTYGGALFYSMNREADPFSRKTMLPAGLALRVFWSGRSARTSELVAKVREGSPSADRGSLRRGASTRSATASRRASRRARRATSARSSRRGWRTPARSPSSVARPMPPSFRRHSQTLPSLRNASGQRSIPLEPAAATWGSG